MNNIGRHEIEWSKRGGPPKGRPNPDYPDGIDLDLSFGLEPFCRVALPYPTGRHEVGAWKVICLTCRQVIYVTAASRPDDPRSVTMVCRKGHA